MRNLLTYSALRYIDVYATGQMFTTCFNMACICLVKLILLCSIEFLLDFLQILKTHSCPKHRETFK